MKFILFCLALISGSTRLLAEQTIQCPEKKPVFSITFPDDWKVEAGDSVSASSADELANIEVLTLDQSEADTAIDVAKEAIANQFKGVKWQGEPMEGEINEMPVTFLTGKFSVEGIKMSVNCAVFTPKKKKTYFMFLNFIPEQAEEKHAEELTGILNSIEG